MAEYEIQHEAVACTWALGSPKWSAVSNLVGVSYHAFEAPQV